MRIQLWAFACACLFSSAALADGPKDNLPDSVRQIPPPGIKLEEVDRKALAEGIKALGQEIDELRAVLKGKAALLELLPDVQIYHNAVRYALEYHEFYAPGEIKVAHELLKKGMERAQFLMKGLAPWQTQTGLVARGYLSKIDGSVQPYGLVVPASYQTGAPHQHRLDIWFHGRGEKLTELSFIQQRQTQAGQFTPPHAFVLHPYGRYCNANHFAGEVDTFEAMEHVRKHYPIDENRIVVRGFSMGGAACWHFATHHAGLWAAAAPGAGFAETPEFLKSFQQEKLNPTWYEKKLWHWYDATDYARNLYHCPTVAYSGEKDSQKQAADIMAEAMLNEGLHLTHLIGPGMGHQYHPQSIKDINQRIDAIVARGRNLVPKKVRFTTWTLRYHKMLWVEIDGLGEHWERATVEANFGGQTSNGTPVDIQVATKNVTALTLTMPPGHCPLDNTKTPTVIIDGKKLTATPVLSDRSWLARFHKSSSGWHPGLRPGDGKLHKRPGLQGPIDDAFMDSFVFVRPTGQAANSKVGKWVDAELAHAIKHWRSQFRGEAPIKDDIAITKDDIATRNLILWGDSASNKVLAELLGKLPVTWNKDKLQLGKETVDAGHHVPVLIYPNPLNPKKYVVLNSSFTFREYDYLNNARQVPKLPDWALLDLDQPATSQRPAGIVSAGFFDELWQVQ